MNRADSTKSVGFLFAVALSLGSLAGGCAPTYYQLRYDGQNAMLAKAHGAARNLFLQADERRPRQVENLHDLGACSVVLAREKFAQANHAAALREIDSAITYYSRAIDVHPGHQASLEGKRIALKLKGEFDEALEHAEWAAEFVGPTAKQYVLLAEELEERGDDSGALLRYRQAIAIEPRNAAAHIAFARFLLQSDNEPAAVYHLQQAYRLDPANTWVVEELAKRSAVPSLAPAEQRNVIVLAMCGICGIVHFDGKPADPAVLEDACAAMHHRGPDQSGTWIDDRNGRAVGLGAVRLAILDPSSAGDQPMHYSSGRYHLAYNGELYNYRALRGELIAAGDRFTTDSDTEVVLAACARWGTDALHRFSGMWALAFYDSKTRTGFLSRDRFGIKPLLYTTLNGSLTFASELRPLTLLGECDRELDPQAIVQHLQFGYIAQPATIYKGARRLEPGHYLQFDARAAGTPTKYFDPLADRDAPAVCGYGEACRRVRRALADAVVSHRVSDVPIGAFLSGGLDSSIIVAHLAEALGRPVETFAVGYAGQQTYDETHFARMVAKHFGAKHHEIVLTESEVLEAIPKTLDHLSEPVGDSSIIPTALISRFARQHVTVALSGDGGDELFGGYWRYLGHQSLRSYQRIPRLVRAGLIEPLLAMLSSSKSTGISNRVRQLRKLLRTQAADPLARHIAWSRILAPEAERLFADSEEAARCDQWLLDRANTLISGVGGLDPLDRILTFDLQHQLPADMLQKVDLASMMHSLEIRVPFLDPDVVATALSLPASFKIDRGLRKRVLTDAYRGRLPDDVLDRGKQGFEVPIGEFLRGPLQEMFHDTVTREAVESFGLLSYDGVNRIYQEHLDRRSEHADVLFALLSFCWWHARCR